MCDVHVREPIFGDCLRDVRGTFVMTHVIMPCHAMPTRRVPRIPFCLFLAGCVEQKPLPPLCTIPLSNRSPLKRCTYGWRK